MKSILEINGIKCDNCEYRDDSVQMEDYHAWLDKPCPLCGEKLLTRDDYEMVEKLCATVKTENEKLPINNTDEPRVTATFEMNGSGNIKIKDIEYD